MLPSHRMWECEHGSSTTVVCSDDRASIRAACKTCMMTVDVILVALAVLRVLAKQQARLHIQALSLQVLKCHSDVHLLPFTPQEFP
jgi:hypothetical protein